jgi:hypothetical protein
MIYLEMTAAVSNIRAYDQPDGYEKRLPYRAIVTVSHLTDTIVYLHGAVGDVDRETWVGTLSMLRAHGVKTVMLERRGKMRTLTL